MTEIDNIKERVEVITRSNLISVSRSTYMADVRLLLVHVERLEADVERLKQEEACSH